MQLGVLFPQQEIGVDASAIRAYAQEVESYGYRHLTCYEHVVGVNAGSRPGWDGLYDSEDAFHEPFVLFAHLAAVTVRLEFATCVLVLPQRQTALVAKQVAELAVLSDDRFFMGVAAGWNQAEFDALGVPWARRGERLDEQITLLRRLLAEPTVDFRGEFDTIPDVGIAPRPARPVPIWVGGAPSALVLTRVAKLGDGWMMQGATPENIVAPLERLRPLLHAEGRELGELGIEGRLAIQSVGAEGVAAEAAAWAASGATHLSIATQGLGLRSVDEHLALLRDVRDRIDLD